MMSCCNQKRMAFKKQTTKNNKLQQGSPLGEMIPVNCLYTGNGFQVFRGAITGFKYVFKYRGHRLTIDPRDAVSLQAEPQLSFLN